MSVYELDKGVNRAQWEKLVEDTDCLYDKVKADLVARVQNALQPVVSNGLVLIETKFIFNGIRWEHGVVKYQLEITVLDKTITTDHAMVIDQHILDSYKVNQAAINEFIEGLCPIDKLR
jgi:hypothetical protein